MKREVESESNSASSTQSESKQKTETNKEETEVTSHIQIDTDENNVQIKSSGLKAGPSQTPEIDDERDSKHEYTQLPESQPYDSAPYIDKDNFQFQAGDFIRYVKEDNIIYQGTILRGQPVEHDFNYYHGQDSDYVVKLDYEDGKHVASPKIQQEDSISVMISKQRTQFGRNIETVSPEEIIAVSPENEYDWYKFEDTWNLKTSEYNVEFE